MGILTISVEQAPGVVEPGETWQVLDQAEDRAAFLQAHCVAMQRAILFTLGPTYM